MPTASQTRSGDQIDLDRLAHARHRSTWAARFIAGLTTPANVVFALLLTTSCRHSPTIPAALGWVALAVGIIVGVPYAVLFAWIREGRVADRQVVLRSQRPALFGVALTCVSLCLVLLSALRAPHQLTALILAMLAGLGSMTAVSLLWKASMHAAVAAGAAAVLLLDRSSATPYALAALPIIGWARWSDGRHSIAQVIGGAVIGFASSYLVYGVLH